MCIIVCQSSNNNDDFIHVRCACVMGERVCVSIKEEDDLTKYTHQYKKAKKIRTRRINHKHTE